MKSNALLAAGLFLSLSACGSRQSINYFTLSPVAPPTVPAPVPRYPVQVSDFHIPAALDRQSMVRSGEGGTLIIDDRNQWGGPLDSMARDVLAQDLVARLAQGSVILPDAPAPPNAMHLVVDIARFRPGPDGQVRLEGSWSLLQGNSPVPALSRNISLQEGAPTNDPSAQVQAMSRLLGRLADHIAAQIEENPQLALLILSTPPVVWGKDSHTRPLEARSPRVAPSRSFANESRID